MYIHTSSYDKEFVELMEYLRGKYPAKLFDVDGIGKQLDMCQFSKDFFAATTTADASVDANSNVVDVSNITYNTELPKPFFKLNSYFILWKEMRKLYGSEVANSAIEKQITGSLYFHDVHGIASAMSYCFNYSTYDIMLLGLPMVTKIKSVPPKHLYSFKSQLEQFVVLAANSTLGATGLADLFIVMSYYVANILRTKSDAGFKFSTEEDCWKYVAENLVSFIYTINQPLRASQSPFTNVSIYDSEFLSSLCPNYIFPDGSTPNISIVKQIQELFLDIMNEEMKRTPITFPISTACFAVNEDKEIIDEEFAEIIAKKNLEFGFINIYCGKSSTLSSCCRLRSDTEHEYFNSFGSGSTKIGSLGVVTVNLPKAAVESNKDRTKFLDAVRNLVGTAARVNHTKRAVVKKRIDQGILPLYSLGFMDLSKQYSTVGVNGLNECCELMGYNILTEEGQEFVSRILEVINSENDKFQKAYKTPHNTEQIPGENVSIKLAEKDRMLGFNDRYDLYSNQFIPLTTKADVLDRIKLQGIFDSQFSGGAICHVNVEQKIEDYRQVVALIKSCAKSGVVYWAINFNIQRCEEGHMSVGKLDYCYCGAKITDNFTRVVGFLVNVKAMAPKRREVDYPNRQFYKEV